MSQATDSIRDYLKSIGRLPLLKPEEEVKLGKAVQKMMANHPSFFLRKLSPLHPAQPAGSFPNYIAPY